MKKLIVCCDGTWNTPDQEEYELPAPTNVLRLYNALADGDADGNEQRKYYHPGVGTEGGFLARTAGGMYGYGLGQNIMSAYAWLARHYEPGDRVYLFGFSRGAFTVRSLGGMLGRCGLLDLRAAFDPFPDEVTGPTIAAGEAWDRVEAAFEGYRTRKAGWCDARWSLSAPAPVDIQFIGVWDTVGALGIPNDLAFLNLLDRTGDWSFHDTMLGDHARFARHAVAMDEMRASFTPTLWTHPDGAVMHDHPSPDGTPGRVRQVYFPGVHSDVGGGYYEKGLADGALQWMVNESQAIPDGLAFDAEFLAQIVPDPRAPIHESVRGVFKALHTRPRNLPAFGDTDRLHSSALDRLQRPPISQSPYRAAARVIPAGGAPAVELRAGAAPTDRVLPRPGDWARCTIYAVHPWNATGLYLEAGVPYRFEAVGEWMDGHVTCGPAGTNDGKFHPGEIAQMAGSMIGQLEGLLRKVTGNDEAELPATKRVESAPWFSLIGVVANDAMPGTTDPTQPGNDGSPPEHQVIAIGRSCGPVTLGKPGHFYAFANDAWHFYGNNRGSVTLRVTRTG